MANHGSGGVMLVHHFLADSARRRPDQVALVCGERRLTFRTLDRDSDAVARHLQDQGIRRGDRVALFLENSGAFVIALWGILKAGAVFVPVNPTTKADKLAYLLNDARMRGLVAGSRLAPVATAAVAAAPSVGMLLWTDADVPAPPRPELAAHALPAVLAAPSGPPADPGLIDEDLATVIYTSGSTGQPKGVMLTHRNMHNTAWAISTYLGNVEDDVVMCVLPLSFDYGLYQVITGARVGFTVVLETGFAYPYQMLRRMAEHRVTGLPGVPTVFAMLLQMAPFEGVDLSALRYLTNTAAALPPAHIRRLQALFPQARLFSMYGLTECTRVSYLDPDRLHDKIDSVGKAMPNSEVYVVDEDGRRLPPGEVGELVVRGANVMRGHWGKPRETAMRLRDGEIPGEKVLYSGDLFRMDEEGFLYFVARKDDVFKCRGEKVSPKEIEQVLHELDAVAEACVVGVDDPVDGTAIKAVIVPRAGAALSEHDVRRHCRARLEARLMPKFVTFADALPRTETGKVRRRSLAEPPPAENVPVG